MDSLKKRKLGENGVVSSATNGGVADYHLHNPPSLSPQDARKIIERFTLDQLLDILQDAVAHHVDVLDAVRSIADADISQRKLFVRGLGWDTTTDGLGSRFSSYGELEEAVVILDKTTGKSKGYGFVTFRHVDGALLALKEPSKKIDGRMTVTQLAAAGNSAPNSAANTAAVATAASASSADFSQRKIYVANVPYDMASDKLLAHFSMYGSIEEGPLGFDKQTGKCRGYAFFVYKFPEGAQAALVQPVKTIEGRQLNCKLAVEGKKGKEASGAAKDGVQAPGAAGGPVNALPASIPGQFGGTGGIGPYTGFLGGPRLLPMGHHHGLNSSIGGPPGLGSAGGYGAGLSGPYGEYGGLNSAGYGGGAGGGMAGPGGGLSGAGAGGGSALYPEGGHYALSSSSAAYPGQHHQQPGTSSVTRVPPGGMCPPPYY